jgi:hypothetical protein
MNNSFLYGSSLILTLPDLPEDHVRQKNLQWLPVDVDEEEPDVKKHDLKGACNEKHDTKEAD